MAVGFWRMGWRAAKRSRLIDRGLSALAGGLLYGAIATATIALTSNGRDHATIWPADAVILALLLTRPRRDWPALFLAGWLANWLANGLTRGFAPGVMLYGAINMLETVFAALWMRRARLGGDVMADGPTITRFLIGAGLVSPLLGALAGGAVTTLTFAQPFWPQVLRWYAGGALGFLVFTPFFMALFDGSYTRALAGIDRQQLRVGALLFALHAMVTVAVVGLRVIPLPFLMFPTLLVISFCLGRLATHAGVMLVAVIGMMAFAHYGAPFAYIAAGAAKQALFFQIYLAVLLCTTLPAATMVALSREARGALAEREAMLRLIMAGSPDAMLGVDAHGLCRWADGPVREYLGYAPEELLGAPIEMIAAEADDALAAMLAHAARAGEDEAQRDLHTIEFSPHRRPGLTLEASLRVMRHAVGVAVPQVISLRDITARKAREVAISRRIETDDLTGLANRAGFRRHLAQAIDAGQGEALTLALIDVDHFKAINDTHGHPAGDGALVEIARRLRAGTREHDFVARLSGDEFAILFACALEPAQTICERIARLVAAEPITVAGNVLVLSSISCGLAQLRGGMTREALFDAADFALYEAKRAGRNGVRAAA